MMFMQFFAFGAFSPILSLYLKTELNFTGTQIGMILASSSIAAFISPLISAFIADRIIRAERLLVLCHLAGAVFMFFLYSQKTFSDFLIFYIGYCIAIGPTTALINTVTFHHSPNTEHRFGNIRVWGTIGWIVVAWIFSYLWLNRAAPGADASRLAHALILSAIASLVLGLYALTLPKSSAMQSGPRRIIPSDSFAIMIKGDVVLICLVGFLISAVNRIYYFGTAPFLSQLGFKDSSIMPIMTLGQFSEVFMMMLLGASLLRFGFKKTFIIGIVAEIIRFSSFALAEKFTGFVFLGILCHGPAFALFFTGVYIYLDSKCDAQSRSGVHQLFSLINYGLAFLFGNLSAGWMMDLCTDNTTSRINYTAFWLAPAAVSILSLILIVLFFPDKKIRVD